jgi:UPF0755 protein
MTKLRREGSRRKGASLRRPAPSKPPAPGNLRLGGFVAMLGLAIGAMASAGAVLSGWSYWYHADGSGFLVLTIEAGMDANEIAAQLAQSDLVGSARLMALYLSTLGHFGAIEPGRHLLPRAASPRTLAACLARASRCPEVEVTIAEGLDHVRVSHRLEETGVSPASEFVEVVRGRELLSRLGIRGRDGEGYLFPATYRLRLNSKPEQLFERFVAETRKRLRRIAVKTGERPFEALSAARGWGESEILTLASIVEKEAQLDEERPVIASVFYNRLDDENFRPKKMLQSDPTAAYGCLVLGEAIATCRDYRQRILPAMLRDPSNPYNSYRHAGLPPGPIASPGEASIVSVLQPAKTDYLFFVATGDGRHRFSNNFEEHEGRVRGTAL